MKASQLMTQPVSVSPEENVVLAARLLSRHNIGALPVAAPSGRLLGLVTDRDIVLRCVAAGSDPETTKIKEIMSRRLVTIAPDSDAAQASRLMADRQVRRVAVVNEEKKLLGMISLADLARAKVYNAEAAAALIEISGNLKRL